MNLRFAFAGFRHPHILALLEAVKNHPACQLVAACEEDATTRLQLAATGKVDVTHHSLQAMLAEARPDVVAVGDVYGNRGKIAIAALEAGCHVLSDKPLCTSLQELEQIEKSSRSQGLCVGCQLDLRDSGAIRLLREVALSGEIGEPCTITIFGQHPLRLGKRAEWYFEPGRHGGTVNDIGIHALDLVEWLTNRKWTSTISAREWNRKAKAFPHFGDCSQFHGILDGGIVVFADVSYLAPDESAYSLPQYWRISLHGTKGMVETHYGATTAMVVADGDAEPRYVASLPDNSHQYLDDFIDEIAGRSALPGLTSSHILRISRLALEIQQSAAHPRREKTC